MRCLSIRQPWAWAICAGIKKIENRSWANDYRGPAAIHAGVSKDTIKELRARNPGGTFPWERLAYGAIVGVADLVDVAALNESLEADDSAAGTYCWVFSNPRLLAEPIPCRGKLQLFFLDDELAARVDEALGSLTTPDTNMAAVYRTSTQSDPLDIAFWRMSAYIDLNKPDDAARQCTVAIEAGAQDAVFFRVRGAFRLQAGEYPDGIADCDRAIELDPDDAAALYNRGLAYEELGEHEKAETDVQRAIQLDPKLGEDADADLGTDAV